VNGNQAVVSDSVVTGKNNDAASSAKLLAATTERPMEILETEKQNETVPVGGGGTKAKEHQPHAKGSRRPSMQGEIKANGKALSCACGTRLEGLPDARRSRWCSGGPTQRKLPARRAVERNNRALEVYQIPALINVCFWEAVEVRKLKQALQAKAEGR
jgi:hypothetical protein